MVRPLAKDDPRQIGPFRIIGLLGGGGMGRVYLGRAADGRTVAVKTARSELADDPGFRTRFAREVAAAQRVGGPFVTPVVDAAPHDEVPWMATDYVPGVSLTSAVQDCGPLPEHGVRLLTAGLLHALTAVHAHGLVHRDLKPSNILLTAGGPRVIDFGIAHSAADTALTMTGTALGTPGFMAPEQLAMVGPKVTGAADVFALGGVIVFAATGSGPFGSTEPQILMYRTVHEEPQLDGLPEALREVAAACLAKDPERRPGLPELMARVGAPGPYDDWLPEPVAEQLRRLSTRLGDPRSPDASTPPPAAEPTAKLSFDRLPTSPAMPSAAPPPPATPPGPHPPGPPHDLTPVQPPHPPGPAPSGPSRRRVLAALGGVGVVAGGGALAWSLLPDGGGDGGSGGHQGASGGTVKPSDGAKNPPDTGKPNSRLPKAIREKGILTIGSDLSYPPMESRTSGKPAGFDIDLANALGRDLGVRCQFENTTFDTLIPGLQVGRYDLVISAMYDTKSRQRGVDDGTGKQVGPGVDFIDYFSVGLAIVVHKGNPKRIRKPEDLSGKTVAVLRDSLGQDYVDGLRLPTKPTIRKFNSSAEAFEDVAQSRSAACLEEFPVAAHTAATLSHGGALELTGDPIDPALYGIAVAKTETALRDTVRESLDRLIRSGEYTRILRAWHIEDGAVKRAEVNGGD
ncbi:hypothetical protein ACZ90_31775 [Streptomyces albus subsp. albus]|nr:hypothetical protein ACZ90_31775 [Streptomyces albus subsp. albus]